MAALVHLTCVVRQKNRFSCVVSRQFSVCSHLYAMSGKHIPANCAKYADNKVAGRATKRNRTMAQRVMNVAYRRVPFDERFTVTAKHTGPHIEGGSVDAAKRTALHMPQPTGYTNKQGKFFQSKKMLPEFIVPDLTGFQLKPYVSYVQDEVGLEKWTAKDLFEEIYQGKIQDEVDKELEAAKKEKLYKKT